jgi:hypothetical protein
MNLELTKKEHDSLYIKKGKIITVTKNEIDFLNPTEDSINIIDIATGLSNTCRFAGQLEVFYSVAQHSCMVYDMLSEQKPIVRLQGLLHDATEAYIHDITKPLKSLLPEYQVIEKRLEKVIFESFELPVEMFPIIKEIDILCLEAEHKNLRCRNIKDVEIMYPLEAYRQFRNRFFEVIDEL